jgi:hypothetical protein
MRLMTKTITRAFIVGAAFALLGSAMASAETTATPTVVAQAQTAPTPKPLPTPGFSYSGFLRAYYFTRTNNPQLGTKTANQAAENQAISAHGAYDFGSGFSVAGTYLYANPFNGSCENPANHIAPPCGGFKVTPPGQPQMNNPDDTLPDYTLNTLYEAYAQYKDNNLFVRAGDQVINTPWANASDSRLKPVAFRGGDVAYAFDGNWSVEGMYMNRWEDRVQSDFVNSTLITQNKSYPDAGGVGNTGIPTGGWLTNNGFGYGRVAYKEKDWNVSGSLYAFDQIANALWFDGSYTASDVWSKPVFSFQAGNETSTGTALAGKINSQVFGVQGAITPWNNVQFNVGFDYIPMKSDTITLPAGVSCGTNDELKGTIQYFLPAGGTPNCTTATPGVVGAPATVYYGGWASPYTDSYATDPLFTTSISQGAVDRRSTGPSVKVGGTFYTDAKQVRLIVSHAWYAYGNATVGVSPTQETDIDGTYFFSHVGKGAYHGLLLRHRYADRTQLFTLGVYGGLPDFKYNRTQLEYDF